jgi:hypothetical protein
MFLFALKSYSSIVRIKFMYGTLQFTPLSVLSAYPTYGSNFDFQELRLRAFVRCRASSYILAYPIINCQFVLKYFTSL